MTPRKGARSVKLKKKPKPAEIFLEHFGKNNDYRNWSAESVSYIFRKATLLSGLISYESMFNTEQVSDLKEFLIFVSVSGMAVLQWIFLITTMIKKSQKDVYSGMVLLPFVLTGGVTAVQGACYVFGKRKFQIFSKELATLWNRELKRGLHDEVISSLREARLTLKVFLVWAVIASLIFILRPL